MAQENLRLRADRFFKNYSLPEDKVGHSKAVGECAFTIAKRMKRSGMKINPDVAYAGGLLHDIGLSKWAISSEADESGNPWPEHAVEGAREALKGGFPKSVVAAIQNHEYSFDKRDIEELKLAPPAIGATWASDLTEAKVVQVADQVVFMIRHLNKNPWKDKSVLGASYGYLSLIYKQRTGRKMPKNHRIIKRIIRNNSQMLRYVKPEDIPPPWKGISTF